MDKFEEEKKYLEYTLECINDEITFSKEEI